MALLHPEVVVRADRTAAAKGAPAALRGPAAVAGLFCGRAQAARPALIDGSPGAIWATARGRPVTLFEFAIADGRIAAIDLVGDPHRLTRLEFTFLAG